MRRLIPILALVALVACSPDKANRASQFTMSSDNYVHCPKCGGTPAYMGYHPESQRAFDCNGSEGCGDIEHFKVQCRSCGFAGWASMQDGRASRMAHP